VRYILASLDPCKYVDVMLEMVLKELRLHASLN